ncbi:MAG: hypothetical protein ONB30_10270 [candidate division KSB1 bacterium]|nr:hypothetical protein [candidate division KSB1 bacterium]
MRFGGVLPGVLMWALVNSAEGGDGRGFVSVFMGGGVLVQEGGSFADLQGDLRGQVRPMSGTNIQWQTVGFRAAYAGCVSSQVVAGYRVWRGVMALAAVEVAWPRYDFTEYVRFSYVDGSGCASVSPSPGSGDLKVSDLSYHFAPSVGLRLGLREHLHGPYAVVEWGKVFRHADLHWNPKLYTKPHFGARTRDRCAKGLMRLAFGNDYPLSERVSLAVQLGFTAVKESGLFFLGEEYATFEGRVGVQYAF